MTTVNYPEMYGASKATIQAELSSATGRYIVRSEKPLTVSRGITFDGIISETGANNRPNRLAGWHRYYFTKAAFDKFEKANSLTLNILLD